MSEQTLRDEANKSRVNAQSTRAQADKMRMSASDKRTAGDMDNADALDAQAEKLFDDAASLDALAAKKDADADVIREQLGQIDKEKERVTAEYKAQIDALDLRRKELTGERFLFF